MTRKKDPLNRTTGPQVLRLFDLCFRQGVFDACELDDNVEAKAFLDEKFATGGYGLLLEPSKGYDSRRWQLALYRMCRFENLRSLIETYIDRVHVYKNTYLFALLPISMRFYLMGIQEWLDYPNPNAMELFRHSRKVHWKKTSQHLKAFSKQDYITLVQEFVYERQDKQYEGDLPATKYDGFANAVWRCNQRYPVLGEETKDF